MGQDGYEQVAGIHRLEADPDDMPLSKAEILSKWCDSHTIIDAEGYRFADAELVAHVRRNSIGLPKGDAGSTFANWDGYCSVAKDFARRVRDWAHAWHEDQQHHSLLLSGPTGCGKTHLATAALKTFASRSMTPQYAHFERMLINITSGGWDADPVGDYAAMPALLIDDYGAKDGSRAQMDKIQAVLSMRIADLSPTIVTTNIEFPLGVTSKQMDDRLKSRMGYAYEVVQVRLDDYRVKI